MAVISPRITAGRRKKRLMDANVFFTNSFQLHRRGFSILSLVGELRMAADAGGIHRFPMVVLVAFDTGHVFVVLVQPVAGHGVVIKLQ